MAHRGGFTRGSRSQILCFFAAAMKSSAPLADRDDARRRRHRGRPCRTSACAALLKPIALRWPKASRSQLMDDAMPSRIRHLGLTRQQHARRRTGRTVRRRSSCRASGRSFIGPILGATSLRVAPSFFTAVCSAAIALASLPSVTRTARVRPLMVFGALATRLSAGEGFRSSRGATAGRDLVGLAGHAPSRRRPARRARARSGRDGPACGCGSRRSRPC